MRTATMSVRGLYNYDNTIFDTMVVPERVNRESLIYMLLAECADLEVMYPNADMLKTYLGRWSAVRLRVWEELCDTLEYDYNPIHNYDRNEEYVDEHEYTVDRTQNQTEHSSHSDKNTSVTDIDRDGDSKHTIDRDMTDDHTTVDTGTLGSDTVNSIAGFNSGTLVTHDKSDNDQTHSNNVKVSGNNTDNSTDNYDYSDTETHNTTDNLTGTTDNTNNLTGKDIDKGYISHKAHLYGNIGVTTTQDMILAQRSIVQFTVEEHIIKEFRDKFTLGVYLF